MKSCLKVCLCIVSLLLLAGSSLWADFGIKAGFNLASQRQGGFNSNGTQFGILAGLIIPMPVNNVFTLQPEIYFIQKGSKKTPKDSFSDFTVTTKLNNLDLVLLSKFHLWPNKRMKPFILFGPYLSFLASGEYSLDGQTQDTDDLHTLEYGYSVGGGVELPMGKSRISLDARFSHSLTDIHKVPSKMWNRGFSFSIGYFF